MRLRFGDWHGQSAAEPDLTIWDQNNNATVAGEVKTPWTVDLQGMMDDELTDYESYFTSLTRSAGKSHSYLMFHMQLTHSSIGQVADYMKAYSYKYGFLTTYEQTVFFKQEPLIFTGALATQNNIRKSPCGGS